MIDSSRARRAARIRGWLLLGALLVTLALAARSEAFLGLLTQLAGTAGCVSKTGTLGACADGTALNGAASVAVSRDGKHVYVASFDSDAVAAFARAKLRAYGGARVSRTRHTLVRRPGPRSTLH